jgi:hypothetical protein
MDEQDSAAYSLPAFLVRWQEHLSTQSAVFKALKNEQKLGWESKALDWLYSKNKKQSAPSPSDAPLVPAPPTTHFFGEVEGLCDRYRKHAKMILQRSDGVLFSEASSGPTKTFVDLGCAPGGVSAFLALDLHWDGVGVSLQVEDGGIAMTTKLVTSAASSLANFLFVGGSVLDPDLASIVRTRYLHHRPQTKEDFVGFDFVNGGAVQDHGQRSTIDEKDQHEGPALPWFYFLVPQLIAALSLVRRDGHGSVMVVYGMSQCGSLMLLLHLLVALRIVPSFEHVDFLETMHLTKPPIYVVLRGVTPSDDAIRVLSQYFFPSTPTEDMSKTGVISNGKDDARVVGHTWGELKAFWQLDGEVQRCAAADAFRACGFKLEVIWGRAEGYLRSRREKAERAMQQSAAQQGGIGGIGRLKRPRD